MPLDAFRCLVSRWLSAARQATPDKAAAFLTEVEASGFSASEVVAFLSTLFAAGYYPPQRLSGDGSGNVRDVSFNEHEIVLQGHNGCEYIFTFENGHRWRTQEGWISRARVEQELGTWPGYLDALEDLWEPIRRTYWLLEDGKRQQAQENDDRWEKAYEALFKMSSLARNPTMHLWRSKNSTSAETVPSALKAVRHVKRLEAIEPSYVYFLLHEGEVVYVGQTTSPWPGRILQHIDEAAKVFDDVWYLEVDRQSVGQVESQFIRHYAPKYNRSGLSSRTTRLKPAPGPMREPSAERGN
jgi:hypothetical protein